MLSLENYYKSFKSYDIRGIWEQEIDADLGYYMWLGLGKYIREQTGSQATMSLWYEVCDYSVIFSASHNTSEYIGIKTMKKWNFAIKTAVLKELFTEAFANYQSQGFTPLTSDQAITLYTPSDILQHPKKKLTDLLDRYFGNLIILRSITDMALLSLMNSTI